MANRSNFPNRVAARRLSALDRRKEMIAHVKKAPTKFPGYLRKATKEENDAAVLRG